MSKIIKSVFVIAAIAMVSFGATRAYFSDTKTISDNQFTSGTVKIDLLGLVNKPVNATNMAPGQEYFGSLYVLNTGTLPANFFMKNQYTSGSQYLYDKLMIRLYYNDDQSKLVWEGPVKDIDHLQLNLGILVPMYPESSGTWPSSIHLWQKIWLPADADNSYQDLSTTFDEIFSGEQYVPSI